MPKKMYDKRFTYIIDSGTLTPNGKKQPKMI